MTKRNYIFFLFFLLTSSNFFAQNLLSGTVLDERSIPIPFSQVYVKNSADLRTVTDVNGYYEMRLFTGEYFLVISSPGYEDRETYISIGDNNLSRNIQLFPSKVNELEEFEFTAKKSNPGRDIMLKVIEKRDTINLWNYPHTCEGYIKATEKIEYKAKTQKEIQKEQKKSG